MLGKRKALMKSIELREKRKRRREELEVVYNTSFVSSSCVVDRVTVYSALCVFCLCGDLNSLLRHISFSWNVYCVCM